MYLLEAATNPGLLPAGSSEDDPIEFKHPPLDIPIGSRLSTLMAEYSKYETPAKFIMILKIVEANVRLGRKTLIWSSFVRNLLTLERMMARYRPAIIYGGIPREAHAGDASKTREGELRRFRGNDDCMLLLANPAATSEGVSLHHICHDAVYLDRTFNAGHYLQSIDRIHRLGLTKGQATRITFLITASTIDEAVNRRVAEKATQLGRLLNDPDVVTMALPDEEDIGPPIDDSEMDLEALFAHLRGEDFQQNG
jgi:SNF2 family DNA or RNA helicase